MTTDAPDRGPGQGVTMELDEFCAWMACALAEALPSLTPRSAPRPEDRIEDLIGGDNFALLRIARSLDWFVGTGTVPLAELFQADTVRDLYLHYLYASSLPLEENQ